MISLVKKKAVFSFLVLLTLCFYQARAQTHVPVYRELIMELPYLHADKGLNNILFSLVSLGGIKYEGFCNSMKCLMLKVDENIYPDNSIIMNKLKDQQVLFIIKPTGKIWQVKESCKDPVNIITEPPNSYIDK